MIIWQDKIHLVLRLNYTITSSKQECPAGITKHGEAEEKFSIPKGFCGQTHEAVLGTRHPGPETAVLESTAGVPESLQRPVFLDSNLKPV